MRGPPVGRMDCRWPCFARNRAQRSSIELQENERAFVVLVAAKVCLCDARRVKHRAIGVNASRLRVFQLLRGLQNGTANPPLNCRCGPRPPPLSTPNPVSGVSRSPPAGAPGGWLVFLEPAGLVWSALLSADGCGVHG